MMLLFFLAQALAGVLTLDGVYRIDRPGGDHSERFQRTAEGVEGVGWFEINAFKREPVLVFLSGSTQAHIPTNTWMATGSVQVQAQVMAQLAVEEAAPSNLTLGAAFLRTLSGQLGELELSRSELERSLELARVRTALAITSNDRDLLKDPDGYRRLVRRLQISEATEATPHFWKVVRAFSRYEVNNQGSLPGAEERELLLLAGSARARGGLGHAESVRARISEWAKSGDRSIVAALQCLVEKQEPRAGRSLPRLQPLTTKGNSPQIVGVGGFLLFRTSDCEACDVELEALRNTDMPGQDRVTVTLGQPDEFEVWREWAENQPDEDGLYHLFSDDSDVADRWFLRSMPSVVAFKQFSTLDSGVEQTVAAVQSDVASRDFGCGGTGEERYPDVGSRMRSELRAPEKMVECR